MMSPAARKRPNPTTKVSHLGLYQPPSGPATASLWKINGHQADLVIWTQDEWDKLTDRPSDAQYHPAGVWCALRLE